ncbi:MAG: GNAT family N-acetyltransferase, partial [Actinomycetota bacterium]
GIVQGNRFSGMVNSHDMERFGKYPIGDIMLRRMIEDVSRRGVTCFDLGVGESDYKNHWCPDTDRLFETILPLTALGYPISLSLRGFHATKRRIKHDETLMGLVKKLRTPGK